MSKYEADEARLKDLASGNELAWRTFYDDMRSPFRLFFLKHTSADAEQVNSLFQDVMVVAHRKITEGGLQAPLRSYLKTYLIGVGKMIYRKQTNEKVQWNNDIPEVPVEAAIMDRMLQQEQARWLESLLKQLKEECQQILRKVYLKGFSMEAVAETMGLPSVGAARKRKFDCLKRMRKLIS